MSKDLTDVSRHFKFGENWNEFAKHFNVEREQIAVAELKRLLGSFNTENRSFLDIGCGSGLSSLAALRLGFKRLAAFDIDPACVETSRALIEANYSGANWTCERKSVFEITLENEGVFDVVYSWGVLHHTGDMWRALDHALSLVAADGLLIVALYRRTYFCPIWKLEKRIYSQGPQWLRALLLTGFKAVKILLLLLRGKNVSEFKAEYIRNRGMRWDNDLNDWLGGYPYESVHPSQVTNYLNKRGFTLVQAWIPRLRWIDRIGILGSGCDEFVFRRGGS